MTKREGYKVTDSDIASVYKSADEGPLECACDGDAQLCVCSMIMMICDELVERRRSDAEQAQGE